MRKLSMWMWRIPRLTCSQSHEEDASTRTWDMLKYRRVRSMLRKPCRQYRTSSITVMCQIKESCIASLPEHLLLLQLRKTWWQQNQLGNRQKKTLSRRGFTQRNVSLIQSRSQIWKHSSLVARELKPRQQKTKLSHTNSTAVWPYNFWSSCKHMVRWTLRNWWNILGAQYHTALHTWWLHDKNRKSQRDEPSANKY